MAEESIGGVRGLFDEGVIPGELATSLLDTAKNAFVDGLGIAAATAAVIVVVTAIGVVGCCRRTGTTRRSRAKPSRSRWRRPSEVGTA